ncbi:MAG: hypothetical protein J1E34_01320 [Oscillospiraceae bacterium]|nr:hypothetical protein [Oscillospiraceae bacterium]
MSKEIKNAGDSGEELEVKTAESSSPAEDIITERKIKAAAVHTVKPEDSDVIYIPDPHSEEEAPKRRFIKTDSTEFLSVRAEKVKNDTETEVTKFTDRFVSQEVPENVHTGHTGKIETYDKIHVPAEQHKMIGTLSADGEEGSASEKAKTDDGLLNAPTKHIDAVPGSLLREIAGTADDDVRRNPDQLMMEGFDSIGKKTKEEIDSDEELKEKLTKSKEERIKNFRFWDKEKSEETSSDTDEKFSEKKKSGSLPAFAAKFSSRFSHIETQFTPVKCEEYTDRSDRRTVFEAVKKEKQLTFAKIIILAVLSLALLGIDIAAKITASGNNGFFTVFGGSVNVLIAVNLLVLAVSGVLLFPELKNGVVSVLKLRPKTDALLLLLFISALVQSVASFFTQLKISDAYQLLAPAAVIASLPLLLGKMFYYDNIRHCFKTVSAKSEKSYLRKVTDPEFKARLGYNEGKDEKNTVYAGKTRFITNFPASGANSAALSVPGSRVSSVLAGVSLIVALIAIIINKSFLCGISALTLCLSLSLPVCSIAATGFYLSRANKRLSIKSSFIQSFEDAKAFSKIDNIVCDCAEIFSAEIKNCLTAKDVSVNQARFAAAATVAGTGSLMEKMFKDDIEKYMDLLPGAQNTVYEDKLGLSAYVLGCTVLLGNHDMLVNHNVELPDEELIIKFLGEDEKPLYLAMEGRFTALFAVKYSVASEIKSGVSELVNSGTSLLLGTNDSNITDVYAEELLELSENSVRIISPAAFKKLEEAKGAVADSESASVVFTDSFESLCRCASHGLRLSSINTLSRAVCIGGAAVSLILGAVLVFTGAFKNTSALSVCLIQCVWLALSFASPFFTVNKKVAGNVNAIADKMKNIIPKKAEKPLKEEPLSVNDGPLAFAEETAEPVQSLFDIQNQAEKQKNASDKADEPKKAPAPEEKQSVIDKETDNAVSGIFEKKNEPKKVKKTKKQRDESEDENGLSSEIVSSLHLFSPKDSSQPENDVLSDSENEAPSKIITSEKLRNAFSSIGGFYSHLTEKNEKAPKRDESEETFSLFGSEKAVSKNADDVEKDYIEQKEEEDALRKKFTAPDSPKAPVFDLKRDKKPAEPKFEAPLDTSDVNVYNDELFKRFEDDKIFAGLHEDEDNNFNF